MGFYVESADRPYESRLAAEDITVGTLVNENGSDAFQNTTQQEHGYIHAVAARPMSGEFIGDDEDSVTGVPESYKAAENDRVPALPLTDGDTVKARTAADNGTDPAPSIGDGDVVGVIDTSTGSLASGGEFEGRLVEEGYTDGGGTPTTYNRSNGNFMPLGTAYKDGGTAHDVPVRVRVRRDNLD